MAYYAHAALGCAKADRALPNFIVPTGNLGNAFACLLARERGLPIGRVMLATNANRALVALAATGRYEPSRTIATLANAVTSEEANIEKMTMTDRDAQFSLINLTLAVRNRVHLARVMKRVRRFKYVTKVTRVRN